MKLSNRVAIVTGGSRGIGRAIALSLAQAGIDVAVNYRKDEGAAVETADQIRSLGRRAITVKADLTSAAAANILIDSVSKELGEVDIVVNNVGEFFFKPLGEMNYSEWQFVLNSNLSSVFYVCRAVLPAMRKRGQGQIINIGLSPTYLIRAATNISAYAIAKTGILVLTRSLAVEEAPYNIRVNCISPGLIDNGHLPPEQREWMKKRVPLGRLGGPEDIAHAVAFLTSEKAVYISGANLAVAGAWDWEDRPTYQDEDVRSLFIEGYSTPSSV
jgi:NAD(P)-dependent dehydrogenase (short-subunit alcohol dehydrogenase family)